MRKIKIHTIIILTLSMIIGGGVVVTGQIYKIAQVNESNALNMRNNLLVTSYSGIFIIESIDPKNSLIYAKSLNRSIAGYDKVAFKVTRSTKIEKQQAVVENDVIIKFNSVEPKSLKDIVPGMAIQVGIRTGETGELIASKIVTGIPFLK